MISILSVPSYLLKNTLHRWVENVASPATKFLIPFLFGVLGLLVFGLFEQIESRLRAQLALDEVRGIRCQEVVFGNEAKQRLLSGVNESHLWVDYCERYESFMQSPVTVSARGLKRVPLIIYDDRPSFIPLIERTPGEPRMALLMTDKVREGASLEIFSTGFGVEVMSIPFPEALKKSFQADAVAAIPLEMAKQILERGYTKIEMMIPKQEVTTKELENRVRQYSYAEGRNVRVMSAEKILEELNHLLKYQKLARWGVGAAMLVVLSLVLGSLSLLEFRQEAYLYALLKSFGVQSWQLFLNGIIELLVISFTGLGAGVLLYYWLLDFGDEQGWWRQAGLDLTPQKFILRDCLEESVAIGSPLYLATGIGCLIASIPLAVALRKQPGLLLP